MKKILFVIYPFIVLGLTIIFFIFSIILQILLVDQVVTDYSAVGFPFIFSESSYWDCRLNTDSCGNFYPFRLILDLMTYLLIAILIVYYFHKKKYEKKPNR